MRWFDAVASNAPTKNVMVSRYSSGLVSGGTFPKLLKNSATIAIQSRMRIISIGWKPPKVPNEIR
jgi:hypothetical protein